MKAMPTKKSTRPTRAAILFPATGLLILTQSLTANAAIQEATDDSWTSTIFSTYGITVLLVVVLGALFVYKKIMKRREEKDFEDVRPRQEEAEFVDSQSAQPTAHSADSTRQSASVPQPA